MNSTHDAEPHNDRVQLSDNARFVLERRYLAKDEHGHLTETPEQLFRRVANNIAEAEAHYAAAPAISDDAPTALEAAQGDAGSGAAAGRASLSDQSASDLVRHWSDVFYDLMTSLRFLPNSPTLGNAGRPLQQLAACFVLPVEDSMASIFETVKQTALVHQSGGGTGFAFSNLRPAGDIVSSSGGIASGPISFMKVFDAATEAIKQGGTRRGANMAILDIHHPDIEAFINVKADMVTLTNFNISVAVDEPFMRAVESNADFDLINPRTHKVVGRRNARAIFDQIVANAWQNGDPGLVFLDRVNRDNPTPALGAIEATNPCGEQPLLPYESCNLGSLNLARFALPSTSSRPHGADASTAGEDAPSRHAEPVEASPEGASIPTTPLEAAPGDAGTDASSAGDSATSRHAEPVEASSVDARVDWQALGTTIDLAIRFLDNVIDMNEYPVEAIEQMTRQTRKVGLGLMGWADLLFQLGIPYDSEDALALADRLMAFIRHRADAASLALATQRGVFPAWEDSIYGPHGGAGSGNGAGWAPLSNQSADAPTRHAEPVEASPDRASSRSTALEATQGGAGSGSDGRRAPLARYRNSTRTTIAPTGTLSIMADCSGGVEPAFALAFTRQHFLDPEHPNEPVRLTEVSPVFAAAAREHGFYTDELIDYLAAGGNLADRPDVPAWARRLFVTAHDIAPIWHVRMQAAFQRHVDNAVSKTINFPSHATQAEVAEAYMLAYREGCKGITIYRDGSRVGQVLSHIADGEAYAPEPVETPRPAAAADTLSLRHPGVSPRRRYTRTRIAGGTASGGTSRAETHLPPRPALPLSEVATIQPCLDCGNPLVFSEGCLICRSCGYTRCG